MKSRAAFCSAGILERHIEIGRAAQDVHQTPRARSGGRNSFSSPRSDREALLASGQFGRAERGEIIGAEIARI